MNRKILFVSIFLFIARTFASDSPSPETRSSLLVRNQLTTTVTASGALVGQTVNPAYTELSFGFVTSLSLLDPQCNAIYQYFFTNFNVAYMEGSSINYQLTFTLPPSMASSAIATSLSKIVTVLKQTLTYYTPVNPTQAATYSTTITQIDTKVASIKTKVAACATTYSTWLLYVFLADSVYSDIIWVVSQAATLMNAMILGWCQACKTNTAVCYGSTTTTTTVSLIFEGFFLTPRRKFRNFF